MFLLQLLMIFYWHEIIAIFCILNTSCVADANICTHGNFYRQLKDSFTLSNGDSKDFYTSHCLTVTFIMIVLFIIQFYCHYELLYHTSFSFTLFHIHVRTIYMLLEWHHTQLRNYCSTKLLHWYNSWFSSSIVCGNMGTLESHHAPI